MAFLCYRFRRCAGQCLIALLQALQCAGEVNVIVIHLIGIEIPMPSTAKALAAFIVIPEEETRSSLIMEWTQACVSFASAFNLVTVSFQNLPERERRLKVFGLQVRPVGCDDDCSTLYCFTSRRSSGV